MRKCIKAPLLTLLAGGLLSVASCAHSPAPPPSTHVANAPTALVSPLSRATIVVRDLDAALDLFQGILEMEVKTDLTIPGPAVNDLLGTQNQTIRILIMNSNGSEIGNIGLLTYVDSKSTLPPAPDHKSLEVGQVALIMNTQDIFKVEKAVRAANYTIISPPMVVFERPKMASQSLEMIFVGPEGIAINLIQQGIPLPQ